MFVAPPPYFSYQYTKKIANISPKHENNKMHTSFLVDNYIHNSKKKKTAYSCKIINETTYKK